MIAETYRRRASVLGSYRNTISVWINAFTYHSYTAYLFIRSDLRTHVALNLLFVVLHAGIAPELSLGPRQSIHQLLTSSPGILLWSWSNLLLFNIHNQRHTAAIDEDAINKPWRPLPSKRLTPQQATWAMYAMYPVTLSITLTFGGAFPCLFHAALSVWYNEFGGDSTPWTKNLLNGFGIASFFAGPLEVASGHSIFAGTGKAAWWLLIIASAIATTVHCQDFRDVEGDRAAGRDTVPLVMGDVSARAMVVVGTIFWTHISCLFWESSYTARLSGWGTATIMLLNLLVRRHKDGDVSLWKLYAFWLLGLFLIPVFTYL